MFSLPAQSFSKFIWKNLQKSKKNKFFSKVRLNKSHKAEYDRLAEYARKLIREEFKRQTKSLKIFIAPSCYRIYTTCKQHACKNRYKISIDINTNTTMVNCNRMCNHSIRSDIDNTVIKSESCMYTLFLNVYV